MLLRRLQLLNFKNHEELNWQFGRINCIMGSNGAGKTNVLDGIYYLSLCKSYFNAQDQLNIRHNAPFFMCFGSYTDDRGEELNVQLSLKRNSRKVIKKNGAEYDRLADHIGLIPLVIITPFDIQLVYENGEERRRFIDNILSQTDRAYLEALMQYNRILEHRNRQLRQFAERDYFDESLLETWDRQLIEHGTVVYQKRRAFFEQFIPVFNEKYALISGDTGAVSLSYVSLLHEGNFSELLQQHLRRDRVLERTTTGPHKDDMSFEVNGFAVKKFASQGQTKSFVIALKLAQYEYLKAATAKTPLLLLDDIFEKLDRQRAAQLMEMVSGPAFGQIFITDTHEERLREVFDRIGADANYFKLEKQPGGGN